ncbi:nucleotide-sugar transporter-domain-containing protein [Kockovaella imperatae]|uniref:Nucleotide-sugar transporter-domain-containing protein n=1 Tax=Kockovaella imperatae TaxID=4999 RepID=A0A1Y1UCF0_9TREE|nr:nucleotide-sugar transporter-domain-containing protein [Kockovaella imperatae]ORX35721.1 nucleotide-sugar transporter-domain-containing protein [Kockovaella imperatae]
MADDDDGLVMPPKAEKENGSVGKSGGVGMGVTRPKRRLSSLPTLPHPFLTTPSTGRALSTSSPPGTPPYSPSTYQALHNGIAAGPASAALHRVTQTSNVQTAQTDEKSYFAGTFRPEPKSGAPTLWGIELKWISLVTLALQNAFLTIIMHYSRISTSPNKTYSASSAVLLNELFKGSISILFALRRIDAEQLSAPHSYSEKDPKSTERCPTSRFPTFLHPSRLRILSKEVFSTDCYKLSVPAILYVIQNNLQYVAASNLDVATFQVTYQMKILTTAFFSVLMLNKRLSRTKWAALVLLALGVGIVQIQSSSAPSHQPADSGIRLEKVAGALRSDIPEPPVQTLTRVMHPFRGFLAVTLACMTSGLAGVYFEFILKASSGTGPAPDLWVRNTQLSLFSLLPALVPILFTTKGPEGAGYVERVMSKFSNFNGWAMGTVLTQTFGGLITAVVIRYSDNIMKGFATSLSIVISFLASVMLFAYPITAAFIIGSSIVLAATYLYNAPSTPSTRTTVAVTPGSPIPPTAPILGEPEPPSRTSSVINLLGLGSASSSRRTSATDLRAQASSLGFTSFSPPHLQNGNGLTHIYPASAPGTPYASTSPSSTNLYDSARSRNHGYSSTSTSNGSSPTPAFHAAPIRKHQPQRSESPLEVPPGRTLRVETNLKR